MKRTTKERVGSLRQLDGELRVALAFLALAVVGWWLHSLALAIVGALGALTCAALYVWQRDCLTAVSYRRSIGATRAEFGDEVALDIEIVNDKLLPVPWLEVDDEVPSTLDLRGATVTSDRTVTRMVTSCRSCPTSASCATSPSSAASAAITASGLPSSGRATPSDTGAGRSMNPTSATCSSTPSVSPSPRSGLCHGS